MAPGRRDTDRRTRSPRSAPIRSCSGIPSSASLRQDVVVTLQDNRISVNMAKIVPCAGRFLPNPDSGLSLLSGPPAAASQTIRLLPEGTLRIRRIRRSVDGTGPCGKRAGMVARQADEYIAFCYLALGRTAEAEVAAESAVAEIPRLDRHA